MESVTRTETGMNPPRDDSLFTLFQRCRKLFQKLILALSHPICPVVVSGEVNVQKVLDEYGRFKIWGEESRASQLPISAGSLDDTLRHNGELCGNVRDILIQLTSQLEHGSSVVFSFIAMTATMYWC
jgi:hypothetical protein